MLLEFCSGGALDDIMLGMILSFLHLIVLLSFFVRWGGGGGGFSLFSVKFCVWPFSFLFFFCVLLCFFFCGGGGGGGRGDFLFLLYNLVCCHYPFLMDKRNF